MARPSLALLVIMICGDIHYGLNQPLLDKMSMEELMRGIYKRHEEEVVDAREVDTSQLMELVKKKLERKMLKETWQNFVSGEPNILQRMTKRWYNNNNNNNKMIKRMYNRVTYNNQDENRMIWLIEKL